MSRLFRTSATSTILWMAILTVQAQTLLDLKSQGRNVDFSGAVATKPFRVGTTLPAVCNVGEAFFKSDAPPGSNVYACTATNTWTVQSGGGGSTSLPATTNLVKGNGSGGAVAANPGADYYKPGMVVSSMDLPPNVTTTDAQNTYSDPGNQYFGNYDVACDATSITSDNVLVKKDSTGTCVQLATSDTAISSGFVGLLTSGSTTANGRVRKLGVANCNAYGTVNTGDWVVPSTHTGGYCEGSASRPPTGTVIVGRANGPSGATVPVDIQTDPNAAGASGDMAVHSSAFTSGGADASGICSGVTCFDIPGDSTEHAIVWTDTREDTGTLHSNIANPTRFTAPAAGWYEAKCQVQWYAAYSATTSLLIRLNGSIIISTALKNSINFDSMRTSGYLHMNQNDYVECFVKNKDTISHPILDGDGFTYMQVTAVAGGAGGGGGATVSINGSNVSTPNFNGTTPAAEANYVNAKLQTSGANVSAEVPTGTTSGTVATGNDARFVAAGKTPMATDTAVTAAQMPALTGDVTTSTGSVATVIKQLHENRTSVNNATSPYTVASTDSYLSCDASVGPVVINLPAASASGRELTVKKTDSSANACTPTRNGSDTIDGATTISITSQNAVVKIIDRASGVWDRMHTNQLGGDLSGVSSNATVAKVNGITVSGTPATGQVLTATSSSAANWQTPTGGSGYSTVQGNGTSAPQRSTVNFIGGPVVVTDVGGATTQVSIEDPTSTFYLKDNFACGNYTSGSIGCLGWFTNAGGFPSGPASSIGGSPGLLTLQTSGTANNNVSLSPIASAHGISATETYMMRVKIASITGTSPTANIRIRVGLSDATSGTIDPPANGMYLEKLETDTDWFCVVRATSSTTRVDTGVAYVATETALQIRRIDPTHIGCKVAAKLSGLGAASEVSNAGTEPSGDNVPIIMITNTAAEAKNMNLNFFDFLIKGLNR